MQDDNFQIIIEECDQISLVAEYWKEQQKIQMWLDPPSTDRPMNNTEQQAFYFIRNEINEKMKYYLHLPAETKTFSQIKNVLKNIVANTKHKFNIDIQLNTTKLI